MKIAPPPFPILSQNGALTALSLGHTISLFNLAKGFSYDLSLQYTGTMVAISPNGKVVAVAGNETLTLFQAEPPFSRMAEVPLPYNPNHLAVGDDGTVVALLTFNDESSSLCAWGYQTNTLQPYFDRDKDELGLELGNFKPSGLQLDAVGKRAITWGLENDHSFTSASGKRRVKLATLARPLAISELDSALTSGYRSFLLPVGENLMAANTLQELKFFRLGTQNHLAPERTLAFQNLQTVVTSPDGKYLGWFYWEDSSEQYRFLVGNLADGKIIQSGLLGKPESEKVVFKSFAVDLEGVGWLVFGQHPNQLGVYRLENNTFVRLFEVTISKS